MINLVKRANRTFIVAAAALAATCLSAVAHVIVDTNSIVFIYSGDTPEELLK